MDDHAFYSGKVISFNSAAGSHAVQYDDGEQESLDLSVEKIKWLLPPDVHAEPTPLPSSASCPAKTRSITPQAQVSMNVS